MYFHVLRLAIRVWSVYKTKQAKTSSSSLQTAEKVTIDGILYNLNYRLKYLYNDLKEMRRAADDAIEYLQCSPWNGIARCNNRNREKNLVR